MEKATIHFPTMLDMLDFESAVPTHCYNKDRRKLTITGYFNEADIELAKSGFNATVVKEHKS